MKKKAQKINNNNNKKKKKNKLNKMNNMNKMKDKSKLDYRKLRKIIKGQSRIKIIERLKKIIFNNLFFKAIYHAKIGKIRMLIGGLY